MGEQRDWGTIILVGLPALAFLIPLVWRLLAQQLGGGAEPVITEEAVSEAEDVEEPVVEVRHEPVVEVEPEPVVADDLKRIEGIGPKISGVLNTAGIMTFAQLAETTVEELARIMEEGEVKISFPETWPGQATLAAAGKWEEFEALLEGLKGGRAA